jgi:hypothetical protein
MFNIKDKTSYKVSCGYAPKDGPRAIPIEIDLASEISPFTVDLSLSQSLDRLEFVQAVYVDNSLNASSFSLRFAVTGQTLTWPAFTQGYLQTLSPEKPVAVATSAGNVVVGIQFLNFPVANILWSVAGLGAVTVTGTVTVTTAGSTGIDNSANQPALLANLLSTVNVNAARNSIEVQNQSADQIQVVLDDGTGANSSIILLASGIGANAQGGDWQSLTFKGRLRVYGLNAGDQVMVHSD